MVIKSKTNGAHLVVVGGVPQFVMPEGTEVGTPTAAELTTLRECQSIELVTEEAPAPAPADEGAKPADTKGKAKA